MAFHWSDMYIIYGIGVTAPPETAPQVYYTWRARGKQHCAESVRWSYNYRLGCWRAASARQEQA